MERERERDELLIDNEPAGTGRTSRQIEEEISIDGGRKTEVTVGQLGSARMSLQTHPHLEIC